MPRERPAVGRGTLAFAMGGTLIVATYTVATAMLWSNRGFDERGPLSFHQRALRTPLPGALPLAQALHICYPEQDQRYRYKIVGGFVDGQPYYACYEVDRQDDSVFTAAVIDRQGGEVSDARVLKEGGAWRWIGMVKAPAELGLGGLGLTWLLFFCWLYYRRPRPGGPLTAVPWWQGVALQGLLAGVPLVGWPLLMWLPRPSRARRRRMVMQSALLWSFVLVASLLLDGTYDDALTWTVLGLLLFGMFYGVAAGRQWLAPPGFGAPDGDENPPAPVSGPAPLPQATAAPAPISWRVEEPGSLPSFADVGGMDDLKREMEETFVLTLAFSGEADAYRVTLNGVLLHGPPGVGKTYLARAVAGEFGLNLLLVSAGDLISAYRGGSARNVEAVFRAALRNIPCLLFFDEFDAIAGRRGDFPDQDARRTVGQLLQSLEEYRSVRELVVMAATNDVEALDPAAIRHGRFDRHIRLDLPDHSARKAIFVACLRQRPVSEALDLDVLARRAAGLSAAAIAHVVEIASLEAFREVASTGALITLTQDRLLAAFGRRGGSDRPTVEDWTWDDLVLDPDTKAELQEIQAVIEDPDTAMVLGIEPPTGILLAGPPGTGKTTVAKVLAAQARCSIYGVSAADLTSPWLGESERNVRRLFERARENRPSVIFIDEIDAIASRRGAWRSYDRQANQLLEEMDGLAGHGGVFVLAATNRADQLDPALLRGGRLSRTVTIPLPDRAARRQLLARFTVRMPLRGIDLDRLAATTEGWSGADLKALCQQAGIHALVRCRRTERQARSIIPQDFDHALPAVGPAVETVAVIQEV